MSLTSVAASGGSRSRWLASQGHVVALDLDPHILQSTRDALHRAGRGNCDLVEGDAYDVARLVRQPVDFVLMANTFHGVPDKRRLVRAVAGVLKANGKLAIINWHGRSREETTVLGQPRGPQTERRLAPGDVTAILEAEGFKVVAAIELAPITTP